MKRTSLMLFRVESITQVQGRYMPQLPWENWG